MNQKSDVKVFVDEEVEAQPFEKCLELTREGNRLKRVFLGCADLSSFVIC